MTFRSCLLMLLMGFSLAASGHPKQKAKKKKAFPYFTLVEAYKQRMLPGIPSQMPTSGEHFIIVWKDKKWPQTFFWRGDNGWQPCKMMKAKKVVEHTKDIPVGEDYVSSHVKGDDIHPGDTLELSPVIRGKFAVPAEIPKNAKNTLFFRVGKSGWLSYPVPELARKADIVRP